MKHLFVIPFVLILSTVDLSAQILDNYSSGIKNYIAVEGGTIKMKIDSSSSLDYLISKLASNWEFNETGKGYWIGYTNDMFSIAAKGDSAIPILLNTIKTSSNKHQKIGCLYSLHLIGIDRRIAGRYYEEFTNPKARQALLEVLNYSDLQETTMRLLIRDPWESDIPYLMKMMAKYKGDSWALVNGLTRYKINNLPIRQSIPDDVGQISIKFKPSKDSTLQDYSQFNDQIKEGLNYIKNLNNKMIFVEDTLFKIKLVGDFGSRFGNSTNVNLFFSWWLDDDKYCSLGSKVQYYFENSTLHVCSIETARKRLINWWVTQIKQSKNAYNNQDQFRQSRLY